MRRASNNFLFCFVIMAKLGTASHAQSPIPLAKADTLFAQGQFAAARDAYQSAIQTASDVPAGRVGLICALGRLDAWPEALQASQDAVKALPQDADLHGLRAITLFRAGQPDEARTEVQQSISLNANDYWGLVATGHIAAWDGNVSDARTALEKAAALFPARPDAWQQILQLPVTASTPRGEQEKAAAAFLALNAQGYPNTQTRAGLLDAAVSGARYWEQFGDETPYSPGAPGLASAPGSQPATVTYTVAFERRDDNYLIVPVNIDGQKFKLLLDTGGGSQILLGSKAAGRLRLPTLARSTVSGMGGHEDSQRLRAETMTVGDLTLHAIPLETVKDHGRFGHEIDQIQDGLFPGGLLRPYVVTLDFDQNVMTLARGPQASAPAPRPGRETVTLPFHMIGSHIFVPLALEGFPLWAMLDTGAQSSVLSFRMARQIALTLPRNQSVTHTDKFQFALGTSQPWNEWIAIRASTHLTLTDKPPTEIDIPGAFGESSLDREVSPAFGLEIGMLLGITELAPFSRITIDYPRRTLTLEYTSANVK